MDAGTRPTCFLCCFLFAMLWFSPTDGHVDHAHEEKAEMLKQKWGVDTVIRDIDHLREDLASMIELADVGSLSEHELAFYMVRMHDFDENGGLDGIELRLAAAHTLEHTKEHGGDRLDVKLEKMIDEVLSLLDLNKDGFVDYGEFKKRIELTHATS